MRLKDVEDPFIQLEQIDMLQRFGISYHFEEEIKYVLKGIYSVNDFGGENWDDNLYITALKFRLLREHRYSIPQGTNS